MNPTHRLVACLAILATLALILAPQGADAQRRGRDDAPQQVPWPSLMAGIHVGYDENSQGEILGAQLRLPLVRDGKLELVPQANVTFATGLKEYAYGAELVLVPAGRRGGLTQLIQ